MPLQEDAGLAAVKAQVPVQHPLLDKVRACSADPLAASFFWWLLAPVYTWRTYKDPRQHPYLKPTYDRMLKEFSLPGSQPFSYMASLAEQTEKEAALQPGNCCIRCRISLGDSSVPVWLSCC